MLSRLLTVLVLSLGGLWAQAPVPPNVAALSTSTDPTWSPYGTSVTMPAWGGTYADTRHTIGADPIFLQRVPAPTTTCAISNWNSGANYKPFFGVAYLGSYYYVPYTAGVRAIAGFTKTTTAATGSGTVLTLNNTTNVRTGLLVTATNIPAAVTVVSFTTTTVTLSTAVTGSGVASGATISFTNPPGTYPWEMHTRAEVCDVRSVVPSYSQRAAWNYNNTRFYVLSANGGGAGYFYTDSPTSGMAYDWEFVDPYFSGTNGSEAWSSTDPDTMWYYASLLKQLKSVNVATHTTSVVHTYATDGSECPVGTTVIGNGGSGAQSYDDRYWAVGCSAGSLGAATAITVYDKQLNVVRSSRTMSDMCGASTKAIDWLGMSPSGKYVIVAWVSSGTAETWSTCKGVELFDADTLTSRGMIMSVDGHNDVGYDANGDEVLVSIAGLWSTSDSTNARFGTVFVTKLDAVTSTPYIHSSTYVHRYPLPCSFWGLQVGSDPYTGCGTSLKDVNTFHISGWGSKTPATHGLFLVSGFKDNDLTGIESPGWGRHENVIVRVNYNQTTDTPAEFYRVSQNLAQRQHTTVGAQCGENDDYWQEPHATPNRDMTKIMFASSFYKQCGLVEAFVVDLGVSTPTSSGASSILDGHVITDGVVGP